MSRPKKGEPGYKEWLSEVRRKAAKKAYADRPELREMRRQQMKRRYKDPKERENCIALCRSHHSKAQHDDATQTKYRCHVALLMQKEADS